jgi:hypothetical protein
VKALTLSLSKGPGNHAVLALRQAQGERMEQAQSRARRFT